MDSQAPLHPTEKDHRIWQFNEELLEDKYIKRMVKKVDKIIMSEAKPNTLVKKQDRRNTLKTGTSNARPEDNRKVNLDETNSIFDKEAIIQDGHMARQAYMKTSNRTSDDDFLTCGEPSNDQSLYNSLHSERKSQKQKPQIFNKEEEVSLLGVDLTGLYTIKL